MTDPKDYKFTDSPLKNYIHKQMMNNRDDLELGEVTLKKYNLTKIFLDDIKFRMLKKKNYVISFHGDTGIGKSTIAQFVGNYTHQFIMSKLCKERVEEIEDKFGRKPVFDVTNVIFDTSEFINRLKESVPMETFIYDENSEKPVGTGSMREKYDKERIVKRVRSFQQNFIFCDPLIDESKLSGMYLYRFGAFDIEYQYKLKRAILEAKNYLGQWSTFGHIITKQFELPGYQKKKDDQILAIEKFEFGGGKIKLWEETANKMLEKGIGEFMRQDWPYMVEEWTNQNYTKDEVKAIIRKIGFKRARKKPEKKVKKVKQ